MGTAKNDKREARLSRKTKETDISIEMALDGDGACDANTGIGFLDHMLELFAKHGSFNLKVEAKGDLGTGAHHTVEDIGITLGQAVSEALGDRSGIRRYGSAEIPMDEALAQTTIDISGRPLCLFEADLPRVSIAGFDTELTEEFYRAFANNAKITLHVKVFTGTNAHHIVESTFKSFARALKEAVSIDPNEPGVPSTKGVLT